MHRALLLIIPLLLSACGSDSWFGEAEDAPLAGERVSILRMQQELQADPELAKARLPIPPATPDGIWPQQGGYPDHAMRHMALADQPSRAWRASVGKAVGGWLVAQPIIVGDRVFTLDSQGRVTAFANADGTQLWRVNVVRPEDRGDGFGGGLAFQNDRLYVTAGFPELVALDAGNGALLWSAALPTPARSGATVADGRVYVVTQDNRLFVFSTTDGSPLWQHNGIEEGTAMLGAPNVAVADNTVIVTYSSGEVFALRAENGNEMWNDSVAGSSRVGELSRLSDVRAMPVISNGAAFVVGNGGRMLALDLRRGMRGWARDIGGVETPAVIDQVIFVLSNSQELIALNRNSGGIYWVRSLPRYRNPDDRRGPIIWSGPVLAGGRLWVASSDGNLWGLDPQNGASQVELETPDGVAVAPVAAANSLFILTRDGELVAYR